MTVAELAAEDITHRLRQGEMLIPTGPLTVRIQADSARFVEAFQILYRDSQVHDPATTVADIVLQLRREDSRTWQWYLDGAPSYRLFNPEVVFAHFEWAMHLAVALALIPSTTVHAAVAARADGRAVALVGRSGSGKSTLLAGLVTDGWRLVTDEFLALRPDGGIDPVPSPIALKGNSIALLRARGGALIGPEEVDRERGPVAHLLAPERALDGSNLRVTAIAFPYYRADEAPAMVPFSRGETILRLAEQSHNFHLIGSDGFRSLVALAQAPAFALRYSSLAESFAMVDRIMGEG